MSASLKMSDEEKDMIIIPLFMIIFQQSEENLKKKKVNPIR